MNIKFEGPFGKICERCIERDLKVDEFFGENGIEPDKPEVYCFYQDACKYAVDSVLKMKQETE